MRDLASLPPRLSPLALLLSTLAVSTVEADSYENDPIVEKIEFAGGECKDFFREFIKAIPPDEHVNFVLDEKVGRLYLPAISLRSVRASDAIRILMSTRAARQQRMKATWQQNICLITAESTHREPKPDSAEKKRELHTFRVDQENAVTLLSALDAALSLHRETSGDPDAVLRLHEESGLLIVVATPAQADLTKRIILTLHESPPHQAGFIAPPALPRPVKAPRPAEVRSRTVRQPAPATWSEEASRPHPMPKLEELERRKAQYEQAYGIMQLEQTLKSRTHTLDSLQLEHARLREHSEELKKKIRSLQTMLEDQRELIERLRRAQAKRSNGKGS